MPRDLERIVRSAGDDRQAAYYAAEQAGWALYHRAARAAGWCLLVALVATATMALAR